MPYREATLADSHVISRLVSALSTDHIAPSLSEDGIEILLASMDEVSTAERIKSGWLHLCYETNDQLVAVVVVKPTAHLYHLFVRTDLHRTGIGKRIFQLADDQTAQVTGQRIATVNASLNAIEAYKRLGFEVEGEIVDNDKVRFQPMVRLLSLKDSL